MLEIWPDVLSARMAEEIECGKVVEVWELDCVFKGVVFVLVGTKLEAIDTGEVLLEKTLLVVDVD